MRSLSIAKHEKKEQSDDNGNEQRHDKEYEQPSP